MKALVVAVTAPFTNHCHWFGLPLEVSVNATIRGAVPDVLLAVNEATTVTGVGVGVGVGGVDFGIMNATVSIILPVLSGATT